MKLAVIRRFNDIEAKERREVGDVIECKKERADVLIKSGYAEKVEQPNKEDE